MKLTVNDRTKIYALTKHMEAGNIGRYFVNNIFKSIILELCDFHLRFFMISRTIVQVMA